MRMYYYITYTLCFWQPEGDLPWWKDNSPHKTPALFFLHCVYIFRVEHTCGVVVDVGHGVATCCVVWEGEEWPGSCSCDPLDCTASVLAKMVHSQLASCTDEMRTLLMERVVVSGSICVHTSTVVCNITSRNSLFHVCVVMMCSLLSSDLLFLSAFLVCCVQEVRLPVPVQ